MTQTSRLSFVRVVATPLSVLLAIAPLATTESRAVVCDNRDPLAPPPDGFVGWWNGSSAVAIGPRNVVSARHVGGEVGGVFWMRGVSYHAVAIRRHPRQDVQVIELAERLPGFHRLADPVRAGEACILGGFGRTAGDGLGNGYDWSGAQAETWGANTIDNAGWLTVISFTDPSHPSAVPHESIFAANDSGAGLFVRSVEGDLRLAGVAVSVGSSGASRYGDLAYCLNVDPLRAWLTCEADFDSSGSVTVHDLYAYLVAWSDHSPRADIAGGDGVGFDDLVSFLTLYLAGC